MVGFPPLRCGRKRDPSVMPSLVPGIHVFPQVEGVDGRDRPGHDGEGLTLSVIPGERSEGRGSSSGCGASSLPLVGRARVGV